MIIKHVDVDCLQQIPTAAEDLFILNGQDALEMVNKVSYYDDNDDDDDPDVVVDDDDHYDDHDVDNYIDEIEVDDDDALP